jgi:hypothetical protein
MARTLPSDFMVLEMFVDLFFIACTLPSVSMVRKRSSQVLTASRFAADAAGAGGSPMQLRQKASAQRPTEHGGGWLVHVHCVWQVEIEVPISPSTSMTSCHRQR